MRSLAVKSQNSRFQDGWAVLTRAAQKLCSNCLKKGCNITLGCNGRQVYSGRQVDDVGI